MASLCAITTLLVVRITSVLVLEAADVVGLRCRSDDSIVSQNNPRLVAAVPDDPSAKFSY